MVWQYRLGSSQIKKISSVSRSSKTKCQSPKLYKFKFFTGGRHLSKIITDDRTWILTWFAYFRFENQFLIMTRQFENNVTNHLHLSRLLQNESVEFKVPRKEDHHHFNLNNPDSKLWLTFKVIDFLKYQRKMFWRSRIFQTQIKFWKKP